MDTWISLAKQIMVYLLLYQIVMNMVQNSAYQKYVGIFLGTILICMIAAPILKFFQMENRWDINYEKNEYYFEQKEAESWLGSAEEIQNEMILEQYRQKIKEQIEMTAERNRFQTEKIKIELEQENFQIKKIEIQLKKPEGTEEDWEEQTGEKGIKKDLEENVEEKWKMEQVKEEIMEIYRLPEESIVIEFVTVQP